MAYIKEYWMDQEGMAEQARLHTAEMERLHSDRIRASIRGTILYHMDFQSSRQQVRKTKIAVEATDSVSAILRHAEEGKKRMAALNFASYKQPGGMFLRGVTAQEECLCHASFLYNVLSEFQSEFYNWNRKHPNRALYQNRGLYSPNILFEQDGNSVFCDVITCAAPNKSAAQMYRHVSEQENTKALRSRIRFVLDIAKENQVELLILGAFGCGVFGQEAEEAAAIFSECLSASHACFDQVVFAIPKGSNQNFEAFEAAFGQMDV